MAYLRIHQTFHWRLVILAAAVFLLLGAVAARIFALAIVEHRRFALAAQRQHEVIQVLPSNRGTIYAVDKNGNRQNLASEKPFWTLVAVPKNIADPGALSERLGAILGMPVPVLAAKLSKADDPYEIVAKKISEDAAGRIRALAAKGLELVEESRRVYPAGAFASSLLGFVSYQDGVERGEYGIEKQYNAELAGERGFFRGEKDAGGYWVALGRRILNPPVNGEDVILTVDPNIQFKVESELSSLVSKWHPESAAALAIEPATGRILALASFPTFDPNAYSREKDFSVFRMPIVDSQFELGSVFKPITMAAAIDAGVITPQTSYKDVGELKINGRTIRNFDLKAHGVQTMTQVLEQSLNTGAVFAETRLGNARFQDAIMRFGFGAKTGVDFPGEVAGSISNLRSGKDIDFATASFGQGIAVTPLQMAMAMGAIANHGVLMKPYLVEKIVDQNRAEEARQPRPGEQIIKKETAETVSKMLVSVVRNGYDNRAGVKGFFVAGKTGTAEVPLKNGRGYSDEVIHTFIGYAPAFSPRFLLLLQMNKPAGNRFAANTLSPAFHNLAEFILNYYEVPPDEAAK